MTIVDYFLAAAAALASPGTSKGPDGGRRKRALRARRKRQRQARRRQRARDRR